MGSARRSAEQRERDREEIERCYARNLSPRAIAAKLGLTPSQVEAQIRAIHSSWIQAATATPAEVRANVLARLRQLEHAAWAEWERSCAARTKRKTARRTSGGKAAGTSEAAELATEDRVGDPRFLAEIRANLAQQAALQGAKQPAADEREPSSRRLSSLEIAAVRARDRREAQLFERSGFYTPPIDEAEYEQIESGDSPPIPRLVVVRTREDLQRFREVCLSHGIPLAADAAGAGPQQLPGTSSPREREPHDAVQQPERNAAAADADVVRRVRRGRA